MTPIAAAAPSLPDPAGRFRALLGPAVARRPVVLMPESPAGQHEDAAAERHLFVPEIFIRASREERSACDYLGLVCVEGGASGTGPADTSLHLVGPGSIRSHAAVIGPGLLITGIHVTALSGATRRISAVLLRVPRNHETRRVIAATESLAVALDYRHDPSGSQALAWGILERVELLSRSPAVAQLVGGSRELESAGLPDAHFAFCAGPAEESGRTFHLKDGHLLAGTSAAAASPWREQDFLLLRVGVRAERPDMTRSIEDLRRQHALLPTNVVVEGEASSVESYQERTQRVRLVSRLGTLYGNTGMQRLPVVTPIAIEASNTLADVLEGKDRGLHPEFAQRLSEMRSELRHEFGFEVPATRLRMNDGDLPAGSYVIMLHEIPLVMGTLALDKALCDLTVEQLAASGVKGESATNPATGHTSAWVDRADWPSVRQLGARLWTADQYIVLHLSAVLRRNLTEFAGLQVIANLLKEASGSVYASVRSAPGGLPRFAGVAQALLSEEVPIREIGAIGEKYLACQGLPTWQIPEEIRSLDSVRKDIRGNSADRPVFRLGPSFTAILTDAIRYDADDRDSAVLAIEPEPTQATLAAVRERVSALPEGARTPMLLVDDWRIRTFLRKLVELEFPHLHVISRREALSPDTMPVLGTIDVDPPRAGRAD